VTFPQRLIAGSVVVALASGCSSSSDSSRVARLNERIAKLEATNQQLRAEDAKLRAEDSRLAKRVLKIASAQQKLSTALVTLRANDRALAEGVGMAQTGVVCGPSPPVGCHIPLSTPGALFTDGRHPDRLYSTPYP